MNGATSGARAPGPARGPDDDHRAWILRDSTAELYDIPVV
jgi:hypothetical protein